MDDESVIDERAVQRREGAIPASSWKATDGVQRNCREVSQVPSPGAVEEHELHGNEEVEYELENEA